MEYDNSYLHSFLRLKFDMANILYICKFIFDFLVSAQGCINSFRHGCFLISSSPIFQRSYLRCTMVTNTFFQIITLLVHPPLVQYLKETPYCFITNTSPFYSLQDAGVTQEDGMPQAMTILLIALLDVAQNWLFGVFGSHILCLLLNSMFEVCQDTMSHVLSLPGTAAMSHTLMLSYNSLCH